MRTVLYSIALVFMLVVVVGIYKTKTVPDHLYFKTGTFAACPDRPSCVSSVANDAEHHVEPLSYSGDSARANARLHMILKEMGARVSPEQSGYIHAVFVTHKMQYHDDLELLLEPDGVIQVRSISRFGYRDFGVNRERVEYLRALYQNRPEEQIPTIDLRSG